MEKRSRGTGGSDGTRRNKHPSPRPKRHLCPSRQRGGNLVLTGGPLLPLLGPSNSGCSPSHKIPGELERREPGGAGKLVWSLEPPPSLADGPLVPTELERS